MRETTTWTYDDGETSGTETAQATGVYKFDMGADQPRESIEVE